MYLRDNSTGAFLPLITGDNVAPGVSFGGHLHFAAATSDLTHVILRSTAPLLGAGSGAGLYEWHAGILTFVTRLPDGGIAPRAQLGFNDRVLNHAISQNGSRVFWTEKEENAGNGHLYMRDIANGVTIQLDKATGVPEPTKALRSFKRPTWTDLECSLPTSSR